ncbi:AGAP012000-PA-like protein [Anopheles sinensis]|uniref:AGAP012000-PA-like protein n=1 Tax=Anopheles sinensis TaxID=74873 RepID=A0A084WK28_ANOSI|nr:AGAP012000-PA-like protein [Anopheles sinensis]
MWLKCRALFVILCFIAGLNRKCVVANADMPSVMEAIINALINFRREMLDNLQLSLEFHTEQLEEIKYHMEHVIEEQETRITKRVQELQEVTNHKLEQQQSEMLELQKKVKMHSSETSLQFNKFANAFELPNSKLVPAACNEIKSYYTGTFYIRPYDSVEKPFMVLCDFENHFNLGGGWTVFQRRIDGSVDFYQNWTMYKNGFGDVNGEHWLGLEKLHYMTESGSHELLVLLEDFEGNTTYALYDNFKIASETEKYKLIVGNYSGTAGDSLTKHNRIKFSTYDQDNDLSGINEDCTFSFKGAWWFYDCYCSNLNGKYYQAGEHVHGEGVDWLSFRGDKYSLKSATMMFRRAH